MQDQLIRFRGSRELSTDEFATIMGKLDATTPLVDTESWARLVSELGRDQALNPLSVVNQLAACSPEITALFRADMGLLRPCRGAEHAQAVLQGFEDDYRPLFQGDQESLRIMRLIALLQDLGKPLSVKSTGDNQVPRLFTRLILQNLLVVLNDETMAADTKQALSLLVDQNIIGRALLGHFDQSKLDELRQRWPARFTAKLDDFAVAAYLADASAHSKFRRHTDIDSGISRCSVGVSDVQLTHLFRKEEDQPLTLCEPYRTSVLSLFPASRFLSSGMKAFTDQVSFGDADLTPARRYVVAAKARDTWSAVLRPLSGNNYRLKRVEKIIYKFAKKTRQPISAFIVEGRYGVIEVVLTRDPSRRFHPAAPSVEECDQVAAQLTKSYPWKWEKSATKVDFRVCVGLLEGYDREAVHHHHMEALPVLLSGRQNSQENTVWQIRLAYLLSARKLPGSLLRRGKFLTWKEKVLILEGKSNSKARLDQDSPDESETFDSLVLELAALFNQDRIFLDDYRRNESIALKQVRR